MGSYACNESSAVYLILGIPPDADKLSEWVLSGHYPVWVQRLKACLSSGPAVLDETLAGYCKAIIAQGPVNPMQVSEAEVAKRCALLETTRRYVWSTRLVDQVLPMFDRPTGIAAT